MIISDSMKYSRKQAKEMADSIDKLELAEEPQFEYELAFCLSPRIIIKNIRDLNLCRRWMEKNLGIKKFVYQMRWYSSGACRTSWKSPDSAWEIWLECSMKNYPKELMDDSCRWKKTIRAPEKTYEYVCEINK